MSLWRVEGCHNPSKAWVCNEHGRISALMTRGAATRMVSDHNKTVTYLMARIDRIEEQMHSGVPT